MLNQLVCSFIANPTKTWFDGEDQNEKVLYVIRRSILTNWLWISLTILFLFVPFFVGATFPVNNFFRQLFTPAFLSIVTLFWYVFVFGFFFQNFFNWFFNVYIITDSRIVDVDFIGLLYKNISETPLQNIQDVTSNISGSFELIFNIGDVRIQTAGERTEFEFHDVSNPARVRDILSDIVTGLATKTPTEEGTNNNG